MLRRRITAATETARALALVARSTYLFRARGNEAVAAETQQGMTARPSSRAELASSGVDPWHLLRALERARRLWPVPVRCLQTAITFRAMLRAHGLDGQLRVGVRKAGTDGPVEGHAWIEIADIVFDPDRLAQGFLPIEERPDRPERQAYRESAS